MGRITERFAAALAALPLLAACAPDLGALPRPRDAASLAAAESFAGPQAPWPQDDWWSSYRDPELTALIAEGLKGAPDLAIAAARLRQAQAQAEIAGAAELPSAAADASMQPTRSSLNTGFPSFIQPLLPHGYHTQTRAALSFSYDLDFWGKNKASLAAATSDAQAAAAELAEARLTLSTAIATAYAQLVELSADLATQQDAVRVRRESAALVESQVQHGIENTGQLAQARAETAIAQGQADQIADQILHTRHQIAALLGQGPDRGLAISPSKIAIPASFGLPPTIEADLVGRRPDLVAARLQAEAAAERIKVAKAGYYPDINLTGQYGLLSLDPDNFLKHSSVFGAIGPAVHLPIFTGGQIEGSYRGARAAYDESVGTYDKTLAHAFEDVADAVADEKALVAEIAHAREALQQSEKAYDVAKIRYRGGLSRYLDVLTAENTVLQQRRQLTDLQAQGFVDDIALIRALGGGFAASPTALAANQH